MARTELSIYNLDETNLAVALKINSAFWKNRAKMFGEMIQMIRAIASKIVFIGSSLKPN